MDFLKALLFGFTVALSVGPIALLILNNGLAHGHRTALKSAFGAACADLTFALLAFSFGSIFISFLENHQTSFKWFSSFVLIGFGLHMCHKAFQYKKSKPKISKPKGFRTTYMLTIVNPLTIIIFAAFVGQLSTKTTFLASIILAFAVFLGSLIVQIALAFSGASLKRFISDEKHIVALQFLSGLGILLFGLTGLL